MHCVIVNLTSFQDFWLSRLRHYPHFRYRKIISLELSLGIDLNKAEKLKKHLVYFVSACLPIPNSNTPSSTITAPSIVHSSLLFLLGKTPNKDSKRHSGRYQKNTGVGHWKKDKKKSKKVDKIKKQNNLYTPLQPPRPPVSTSSFSSLLHFE